ncbi:MAG: secretin N-terminal domain-containing protein, partial [Mariprofundaceae bacterium]
MNQRRPSPWIPRLLLLVCLLFPRLLLAETATVEVFHLPLHEAAAAVKSQLSERGSVATLPSRQLLIINDESKNIRDARKLLKKLDVASAQYALHLEIIHIQDESVKTANAEALLPGGWVRLTVADNDLHSSRKQSFSLHLSANREGMVETGTLQPYRKHVRQWLAGYGVISSNSVELVSVTSGFIARVRPADSNHVQIRIEPWMRNLRGNTDIRSETEILIDLGSTTTPKQAPSNQAPIRLNARPHRSKEGMIEIAGAATELTIPL